MAKKERGYALKAHDLAQKAEAFKAEKAEFEEWKSARARSKTHPGDFLKKEYGDDWYDKLTEFKLSGGKVTPELLAEEVNAKFADLEKRQEEKSRKQLEEQKANALKEEERLLANFQNEVSEFVKAAPEYELINGLDAQHLVAARIKTEHDKTGKLLSYKEAADLVEQDLENRTAKTKKFQRPQVENQSTAKRNDPTQRRTLSNDMSGTSASASPPPMNDAERKKRALAAMDAVLARRTP